MDTDQRKQEKLAAAKRKYQQKKKQQQQQQQHTQQKSSSTSERIKQKDNSDEKKASTLPSTDDNQLVVESTGSEPDAVPGESAAAVAGRKTVITENTTRDTEQDDAIAATIISDKAEKTIEDELIMGPSKSIRGLESQTSSADAPKPQTLFEEASADVSVRNKVAQPVPPSKLAAQPIPAPKVAAPDTHENESKHHSSEESSKVSSKGLSKNSSNKKTSKDGSKTPQSIEHINSQSIVRVQELSRSVDTLRQENLRLQNELTDTRRELLNIQQEAKSLRASNAVLKEQVEKLQASEQAAVTEPLQMRIDALEAELRKSRAALIDIQTEREKIHRRRRSSTIMQDIPLSPGNVNFSTAVSTIYSTKYDVSIDMTQIPGAVSQYWVEV